MFLAEPATPAAFYSHELRDRNPPRRSHKTNKVSIVRRTVSVRGGSCAVVEATSAARPLYPRNRTTCCDAQVGRVGPLVRTAGPPTGAARRAGEPPIDA